MFLSVSRRTDIPRWYGDWFINRLHKGEVSWPAPYGGKKHALLTPGNVEGIVFWTKNPQSLLPYLNEIEEMGYPFYFQFTLTPYGLNVEPACGNKTEIQNTFVRLSRQLGKARVVWRYDPILLSGPMDAAWHREQFLRLLECLAGYTDTVVISFVDMYKKLQKTGLEEVPFALQAELAAFICATAHGAGLRVQTCCEQLLQAELAPLGIEKGACISAERFSLITGKPYIAPRDKHQRPGCGCAASVDIGAYNTCPSGCLYCYANTSHKAASARYAAHNPGKTSLV